MVKDTQKICRLLPTNYLSVFEHFVWLELKRLTLETKRVRNVSFSENFRYVLNE